MIQSYLWGSELPGDQVCFGDLAVGEAFYFVEDSKEHIGLGGIEVIKWRLASHKGIGLFPQGTI